MVEKRYPYRAERVRASLRLLRTNRRRGTPAIRTPAGGGVTKSDLEEWVSDNCDREALGPIIDVYIEQVCYFANQSRGLIGSQAASNKMRAVFMQPQAFFNQIYPVGGEVLGSQTLRAAGISKAEFRQLEYFFMPLEFGRHSSLIAVSPRNHSVELLDPNRRRHRAMCRIFHIVIRFLIHELGSLEGPHPWMFLHGMVPHQRTQADCGNFTCFYAKALALHQPLDPNVDIGQGPTMKSEREDMKFRLIDDLIRANRWTAETHPIGNSDPSARHGPGGFSEPQHRLFWNVEKRELVDIETLRSRTGRFDHMATSPELALWCLNQSQLRGRNGFLAHRMDGFLTRAFPPSTWRDFVTWIEWREMDILNGLYP